MATQMTTTTVEAVRLKPALAKKLKARLQAYATVAQEIKRLKESLAAEMFLIEEIREQTGATKLDFEGTKITRIEGTYKKLNQKKLIQLGCAAAWIEEATENHPRKAYTKVTLPGEKDYSDE